MGEGAEKASSARRGGPLARFRIVDLTRVRAGPTAARHFADWGADVIRVEAPEGMPDDPLSAMRNNFDFQNLHRNKRSMTLNLREEDGRKILYRLIETADVFMENARPDVKNRLNINYETLSAINPRLVYASISGFGQDGPYADRPGYDQIAQGMGGMMSVTGEPGRGPMRAGIAVADSTAGLFTAMGVMTALLEREASGKGQFLCTSLLQAQIALMDFQAARYLVTGDAPEQTGNDHPYITPMGVFEASDGHVNIAVATDDQWRRLCKALDGGELAEDPRFATFWGRAGDKEACKEAVTALTRVFPAAETIDRLNAAGVPAGPIYDMQEVFEDPQVKHLKMAEPVSHDELGDIRLVGQPIEMHRTRMEPSTPTPARGAHTDELLEELGFSADETADFRERRVI